MEKTIKLKKKTLVLSILLLLVASILVFTFVRASEVITPIAKKECPKQTGTCSNDQTMCQEDLGPRNDFACQYKCVSGVWDKGYVCSYNVCNSNICGGQNGPTEKRN